MENLLIPGEAEIKKWIKESIAEYFVEARIAYAFIFGEGERFVGRQEIAQFLDISLVTLHEWVKQGLPAYKKKGKVFFLKSEVRAYIMLRDLQDD
jgi:predicted DNA-binding transcriptional regulator AlpA